MDSQCSASLLWADPCHPLSTITSSVYLHCWCDLSGIRPNAIWDTHIYIYQYSIASFTVLAERIWTIGWKMHCMRIVCDARDACATLQAYIASVWAKFQSEAASWNCSSSWCVVSQSKWNGLENIWRLQFGHAEFVKIRISEPAEIQDAQWQWIPCVWNRFNIFIFDIFNCR